MSRLARAPERSSPVHEGSPSVGAPAQVLGQRADVQLVAGIERRWPRPRPGPATAGAGGGRCRSSRGSGRRAGRPAPPRTRRCGARAPWRRRAAGRRCRSPRGGTRPARWSRRGPTTRTRCGRWPRARPATPRRARSRTGAEDLRHLGDVAEHVGQVADLHRAAEAGRHGQARCRLRTSVSPDTRNSSGRVYHGPIAIRPVVARRPQAVLGLGADREVVVDHGHLPVEQEVGVGRVGLELGQELVEQVDEPQPERLERRVPLAVPVGVGDDVDASSHLATMPRTPTSAHRSRHGPEGAAPPPTMTRVGRMGSARLVDPAWRGAAAREVDLLPETVGRGAPGAAQGPIRREDRSIWV